MDMSKPYRQIEDQLQDIEQHQLNINQTSTQVHSNYSEPVMTPAGATVQIMPMAQPNYRPVIPLPVGPKSMEMTCPNCNCRITTTVRHRSTSKTHIACLLLSWTLCCCCLPYCMDSCRNANHFCPMCGTFIGTYAS
ncbi:lipopolysaccharide-induced tumor necrosis factor-alpha factor homolog [Cochliomyia hominivorax]